MKQIAVLLFLLMLVQGCTVSPKPAPATPQAVSAENKADSTEDYYDPEYGKQMPTQTSWVLHSINGQLFAESKLRGEGPTMDIDLTEGKARGLAGCNRYNTSVKIEGEKIYFGHIVTTKTNCASIVLEKRFLGVLNFGLLTYRWVPGKLFIQRDARSVLEFRDAAQYR